MSAETEHAEMLIEQQGYDIVLFFGDSSSEGEDTERLISGEIALFSSRTASLEQQLSDSDQILILAGEYNFSNAVKQLLEPFAHCTVQTVSSVEVMQTLLLDENACAVLPNFIRFRGRKIKMHPLPNSIEAHLYAKINLTNATSPVRSFVQCFIGQAKGERL
jgi:DNA-binding transcriptional LysR family regulator